MGMKAVTTGGMLLGILLGFLPGYSQISVLPTLEGCTFHLEVQNTPDGFPFFAIKDERNTGEEGVVMFNPGGSGWVYSWSYNGVQQVGGQYSSDSSSFRFNSAGNGVYTVMAEKADGSTVSSGNFRLFYDYVPDFRVTILNEDDCEYVTLQLDGFVPPAYDAGYDGSQDPVYTVVWGNSEKQLSRVSEYYTTISQFVGETYQDVTCRIRITDRFGLEWTSEEMKYISVVPNAAFRADPPEGEAPLEVTFVNETKNAQEWEWYLYKDTLEMPLYTVTPEDSLVNGEILREESPRYTYEHPGAYNVKLIVVNTKGANRCADTVYIEHFIQVDSSLVDMPNVFTPNGDGVNDIFKPIKTASLESFHGIILNRWGRKIYEWHDPQKGWDGKISGKYASPGTYFYIVTAKGREIQTKKYMKKGALLLIR